MKAQSKQHVNQKLRRQQMEYEQSIFDRIYAPRGRESTLDETGSSSNTRSGCQLVHAPFA
jgi:hypothetical protein